MSQLVIDKKNECEIPREIILKIIYEMKGLQHPTSRMLKDYINNFRNQYSCFKCEIKVNQSMSLALCAPSYINHHKDELLLWKKNILDQDSISPIYVCWGCGH